VVVLLISVIPRWNPPRFTVISKPRETTGILGTVLRQCLLEQAFTSILSSLEFLAARDSTMQDDE
jgi:hypothetical protein